MALNKRPGVQPVGIGKAIRRLMAKLVQAIISLQALAAYRSSDLCARLKYSIEGALHASEWVFGKRTAPKTVSSNSHTEVATRLETMWVGCRKSRTPMNYKGCRGKPYLKRNC